MPSYIECPSCHRKLRVPDSLQAGQVKCPSCLNTFEASEAPQVPIEEQPAPEPPPPPPTPFSESAPAMPQADRHNPSYDNDPPFPRDYGPRRDSEPHRANLILTLGVISVTLGGLGFSLICCGGFLFSIPGLALGLPAAFMGAADLRKMSTEAMDPAGRSSTQSGMVCGIIGASLSGLMLLFMMVYIAIIVVSNN